MTDFVRQRLQQLLSDSSAFNAGKQSEQDRIRQLIDIRVDELHAIPSCINRQQICSELLRLRQFLDQ